MISNSACQISVFQDLYFKKYEQNNPKQQNALSKPVALYCNGCGKTTCVYAYLGKQRQQVCLVANCAIKWPAVALSPWTVRQLLEL